MIQEKGCCCRDDVEANVPDFHQWLFRLRLSLKCRRSDVSPLPSLLNFSASTFFDLKVPVFRPFRRMTATDHISVDLSVVWALRNSLKCKNTRSFLGGFEEMVRVLVDAAGHAGEALHLEMTICDSCWRGFGWEWSGGLWKLGVRRLEEGLRRQLLW